MSASGRVQPGDLGALLVQDDRRDDRGPGPEERHHGVEREVEPVLHREQQRGAELNAEEAGVAEIELTSPQPPNTAYRTSPRRQTKSASVDEPRHVRPLHEKRPRRLAHRLEPEHRLHREGQRVPERQPPRRDAQPPREEGQRHEVAREDEEQPEPQVVERERALPEEPERSDREHRGKDERPRPQHPGERDHPVRGVGRQVPAPRPEEGADGDREGEDRAHRDRGEGVDRVVEEGVERAKEAHGELPLADLDVHLPDDP